MTVYLLDTSAVVDDSNVLFHFQKGDIVLISSTVVKELDGLKESKKKAVAKQARKAINIIDECRKNGDISKGVELENGSILKVAYPPKDCPVYESFGKTEDTEIIATGLCNVGVNTETVEVVSTDTNFRIIADLVGLGVFEYLSKEQQLELEGYLGYVEIDDQVLQNSLVANNSLHIARIPEEYSLHEGTYVVFGNNREPASKRVIGMVKGEYIEFQPGSYMDSAGRFRVKNIGQRLLAHAIMDDSKTVITVEGVAGTGKTLEALAYSLRLVDDNKYSKVICYRAIADLDEGLGALPGSMEEKLAPWTQPFFDNLEFLGRTDSVISQFNLDEESDGAIEINALTYARGRSLPNVIIIVDEAQNLTRLQAKTMATRLGEGAKIIFLYDAEQIDHKYLDRWNNGGVHVATRLRGHKIHAHVTLTDTVRSYTAGVCAKLL